MGDFFLLILLHLLKRLLLLLFFNWLLLISFLQSDGRRNRLLYTNIYMVSLPINLREIKMKKSSSSSYFSQKRTTTQSNICFSYYFIPLSVLICLSVLYGEDFPSINIAQPFTLQRDGGSCGGAGVGRPHHEEEKAVKPQPFIIEEKIKSCDIFAGKWVYDEASTPYYTEEECPYLRPELTCQEHGRPDKMYQHWRWQPHNCSLPSFNSTLMLEKLRGKRMLFVGDSLNRGQFISMVCLLHGIIPETAKSFEIFDSLTVFTAKEYNATVEFYWAPFLVESNADDAVVHRIKQRIVRIGCIKKHAKYWKGSDIIVFNSYVWWMTGMPMQTIRGPFSKGYINDTKPMQTVDIYRITMRSVLKWVKKNMNPLKTRVFFTSMSPAHEKSMEWGGETKGNCFNETKPIEDPKYWGEFSNKTIMKVIGDEFKRSKLPITFINITQLSEYRKDAHTTIYKKRYSKPLTPKQIANPKSYADCIHWCLPGLQDTWNQLLYTKLFFS